MSKGAVLSVDVEGESEGELVAKAVELAAKFFDVPAEEIVVHRPIEVGGPVDMGGTLWESTVKCEVRAVNMGPSVVDF